jgi:Ca-activated chloride channel homolog
MIMFAVCNQEEVRSMSKTQWFPKKDLVRRTGGSSRMFAWSLFACFLLFYPGTLTSAQSMFPEDRNHEQLRQQTAKNQPIHADVDLALINVTVTDPHDHLITGLEAHDFRLYEDNVEQQVVNFSSEETPLSIGLIFDLSGSMANKLNLAKEAAVQFLKTTNSADEVFLIGFGTHAELITSFNNNLEDLQNRLFMASATGSTSLLDAIQLGIIEMRSARNTRRALLIISDGGDNHSRYSEGDLKKMLREADTQLYAIGIFEPAGYHRPTLTDFNGPMLLDELTELTGGRCYTVRNRNDLEQITTKIGTELHHQYILGYHPSNNTHDAHWRKVTIKLHSTNNLSHLSAHAKRGYYAANL